MAASHSLAAHDTTELSEVARCACGQAWASVRGVVGESARKQWAEHAEASRVPLEVRLPRAERDRVIADLWGDLTLTTADIGERIGISQGQVSLDARRIGLPNRAALRQAA